MIIRKGKSGKETITDAAGREGENIVEEKEKK